MSFRLCDFNVQEHNIQKKEEGKGVKNKYMLYYENNIVVTDNNTEFLHATDLYIGFVKYGLQNNIFNMNDINDYLCTEDLPNEIDGKNPRSEKYMIGDKYLNIFAYAPRDTNKNYPNNVNKYIVFMNEIARRAYEADKFEIEVI